MKRLNPLAGLFGKSPFGPIQDHMRTVERCVLELPHLIEALRREDMDEVLARKDAIFRLEREADEIKNDIRLHLPATFLMPVGRRDLLDLLGTQDAIAGAAQDVASLLSLGRLRVPPSIDPMIMPFVSRNIDAVQKCTSAVEALDELLETGFRGREADNVLAIVREVDRIETEADSMGMDLVRTLISDESGLDPLSIVFWYQLIRTLGNISDEAENAGDRLRLLLAR